MLIKPTVSILIATRNRATHLQKTLARMQQIVPFSSGATEILIVDNNSTDETRTVAESFRTAPFPTRYCFEPRTGKTTALNTAMDNAHGDIFLWTDDDVVVPDDWISKMCGPIALGEADGVSGKIRMAPDLERPWMTRTHYDRVSDTRFMPEFFGTMIGANAAFHRKVREKVPFYDIELGPGRLGFMDDSLFSFQFLQAGYKMISVSDAEVEHHFEPNRLQYRFWLRNGEAFGRSEAYVKYHWSHETFPQARLHRAFWQTALRAFRVKYPSPTDETTEGCDRREIRLIQNWAFADQFLKESRRLHNYFPKGLRRFR